MSNWIIFSLASSFTLALSCLIDRLIVSREIKHPIYYFGISSASGGLIFILSGLWLTKGIIITSLNLILPGIIIGLILSLAILVYLYALRKEEASTLAPVFSLVPLFVLIIAILFWEIKFTPLIYLGCLLIITGLFFLSQPSFKRIKTRQALSLAFLATFLFAISNLSINFSLEQNTLASIFFWIGLGRILASLIFMIYYFKKINDRSQTTLSYIIFAGTLGALSFVLFALAANLKSIVHASMISETYPLFIIILILLLNRIKRKPLEKIKTRLFIIKIIATLFIIIGTLLIT